MKAAGKILRSGPRLLNMALLGFQCASPPPSNAGMSLYAEILQYIGHSAVYKYVVLVLYLVKCILNVVVAEYFCHAVNTDVIAVLYGAQICINILLRFMTDYFHLLRWVDIDTMLIFLIPKYRQY